VTDLDRLLAPIRDRVAQANHDQMKKQSTGKR
jgi:hypothetical protein